jgi:hypothetical protein
MVWITYDQTAKGWESVCYSGTGLYKRPLDINIYYRYEGMSKSFEPILAQYMSRST